MLVNKYDDCPLLLNIKFYNIIYNEGKTKQFTNWRPQLRRGIAILLLLQ
jgi:hypothetical protein